MARRSRAKIYKEILNRGKFGMKKPHPKKPTAKKGHRRQAGY